MSARPELAAELRRAGATLYAYRRRRAAEAARPGLLRRALRLVLSVLPGRERDE